MKKIFFLLFLFCVYQSLYSQQQQNNNTNFVTVQMLIKDDVFRNSKKIFELSKGLTAMEKSFIYSDRKITPIGPFFLNLFLGFGIGSWVQGDNAGGLIGTVGNFGGYILMISSDNNKSTITVGALVFLATYLADLILPFTYAANYNNRLFKVLGISDVSTIKVIPSINYSQNGTLMPGIGMQVGF